MESLSLTTLTSVIFVVMITFNAFIVESQSQIESSSPSLATSPPPPVSPPPPPSRTPSSPRPPSSLSSPHPPPPRSKRRPPPPPPRRSFGNGRKRSRSHPPPPPPPSLHNQKMNTGKKVGLLFVGIAAILQIGVVGFLVFKRRQLLKMHYDTCSS